MRGRCEGLPFVENLPEKSEDLVHSESVRTIESPPSIENLPERSEDLVHSESVRTTESPPSIENLPERSYTKRTFVAKARQPFFENFLVKPLVTKQKHLRTAYPFSRTFVVKH